jgi:ATP-dependent DNA helicase RecG
MDERDRTILLLIQRFGELGNEAIQSHVDSHPKEIWSRLSSFSDRGWLEKYVHGRGTKYRWPRIAKVDKRMLSPEHMLKQERGAKSEHLPSDIRNKLQAIAAVVSSSGKVSKVLMEKTILELCTFDWLSMHFLAELLNRNPDSLRNHYIKPMLKDGRLSARVPGKPNHPNQAYRNLGDG